MSQPGQGLLLHTSPHLPPQLTTPKLMLEVCLAVVPVVLAAVWFFGLGALLVILASTLGAIGTEWYFTRPRGSTLHDRSALLTGVLLGLTLPPGLPLWMAFVGGVVGIGLGKIVWGGMGHNLFNPALVGRAFLQAAFPIRLTTWVPHGGDILSVRGELLAPPLMQSAVDGTTAATPLAMMKFENVTPDWMDVFLGTTGGALGETSAVLLILCGLWMGIRRLYDWRIPVAIFVSVAVFSGALCLIAPGTYPTPWMMLMSGGLLFGAFFMATDPVGSPLAPKGAWIFGIGIGVLVVLIRLWGGLPEGVMYAILLMNSAAPLIERASQPRVFGRSARA
jgi:H+/Na+-translocating ferredoxin:NAD+ oxidoreductase subunit D